MLWLLLRWCVMRCFFTDEARHGSYVTEQKNTWPTTTRRHCKKLTKGPDALDWQNLFGPSKNLDKICLSQIFNLVIVGALKNFFFRSCRANCKICTVFTPDKNLSCSKAGQWRLWSLVMLDKIWWEKNRAHLYDGNDDKFFRKIHKNCLVRPGRNTCILIVIFRFL